MKASGLVGSSFRGNSMTLGVSCLDVLNEQSGSDCIANKWPNLLGSPSIDIQHLI